MSKPLSGPVLALLAIIFCTIWSSAFIATKIGLWASPPLTLATLRFLIAGPVMLAAAWLAGNMRRMSLRDFALLALLGVLNNTIYLGLTFVALQNVSAGLVSILASLNPLLVAALAHFLLSEALTLRKIAGLMLGVGGVAAIMGPRISGATDSPEGIILALIGILSLVFGTILFKRLAPNQNLLVVNGVQVTVGGLCLLPFAMAAESWSAVSVNTYFIGSVLYLAAAVSIGGTLLWFYLLRAGSASMVSSYHFLNPGLGLLMGWAILGEHISLLDLAGLIPVAAGIILVTRSAPTVPVIRPLQATEAAG